MPTNRGKGPSFTVGIEEEYLLVDAETRDLITEAPPSMLPECESLLAGQVTAEFLQSQIEVGTRVCTSFQEARDDLAHLRQTVARVAEKHGLGIIAASTHPFAIWETQKHTQKERYTVLARDMRGVVRRLMISGMHVHVAVEEEDLRIDLLDQVSYILPHLLALSTSSPFWRGEDAGLKSYRIAVWDALPRTGLPEHFDSYGEFQRHVDVLVRAGLLEDSSKLWWDVRPSARFPTLEMRISDMCTRVEDTICIAALYRCWLRMLYRLRLNNQRWRRYSRLLLNENRWLAQRYGFEKGLVDFGRGELVPYAELLDEMLSLVRDDAEHFDCLAEVEHARRILERGTSAHWQLKTFEERQAAGASREEAFASVVDMLMRETLHGL
ncbi:MAG: carboxylate-amine ligase [Gammaproteobacteria bacterium]|nr:carboxylate-amine ligase [Gammaproteobacteria bacterium]NIR83621.1 carboxylate-amine ligase [Gammaproteobacteria bacterium]NIR91594.1 carboxylate-amine ligase [Gammaproteobacteria bacterium]NIU04783.1 carboxylate-amine ligase [Gammaproteobacteria bacterium]NIV53133.1 carboxylate-amine ligase [Gammaproteobacteria bacterium]